MATETPSATSAAGGTAQGEEVEEEDDEPGPAQDYGVKVGLPLGLIAAYLFLFGPDQFVELSPAAGEIVRQTDVGFAPFFQLAGATLVVSFVGGVGYPLTDGEVYEDYRTDLAIGTIMAPSAVVILTYGSILADPVLVSLLQGNVGDAVFQLVVALVVIGILLVTTVGILALLVVFGVYLGVPAAIGAYAGTFLGEQVS